MDKYYLLLKKVRSAGIKKLFIILYYKFYLYLFIEYEKIWLHFHRKTFRTSFPIDYHKETSKKFARYYDYINLGEDICKYGDEILNGKLLLFGNFFPFNYKSDWLRDPISKQNWDSNIFFKNANVESAGYADVKYVMEINKLYHIVALAESYYISKDKKYIDEIKNQITFLRCNVKYERSVVNKSMLDLIYRCYNYIHITLLCYENAHFRNSIFPQIIVELHFLERQIRRFSTPRWCKYSSGANHTIGEMAGLIVIQLFLHFFTGIKYNKYFQKEFQYLYKALNPILTSNGAYLEQSANYSKLVAEFLVFLDLIGSSIGDKVFFQFYNDNYLRKLLRYISIISYKDILPDFGDNDGAKALTPFYQSENSISHLCKYYIERYNPEQEFSFVCKESGQFSWKSNNFHLFFRSGKHSYLPIGAGSHAHNDINAILLSIDGGPFFIDYGTYFYNSGVNIINDDRATKHHNTVYFSDIEQATFGGKWKYISYPKADLEVLEDITDTYFHVKGICEYKDISHLREVKYSKKELTIIDKIKCNSERIPTLFFLLAPNLEAKLNKDNIIFKKRGIRIASLEFDSKIVDCTISKNIFHPSYGQIQETFSLSLHSKKRGPQTIKSSISIIV